MRQLVVLFMLAVVMMLNTAQGKITNKPQMLDFVNFMYLSG